ncbi:sigma-54-dependent Fis family transcriptional regulator [bacterium]|nr:sigma-54-dependent Fis family transcriptional regulator [bacterium]
MSRILIIDDEKNIRRTFGMVLKSEGFEVVEAGSGEDGLDLWRAEGADVVILDVRLPGLDGLEVLRRMRTENDHQQVVMISGHGTISTALEATREGAFDFLEKPCSRERVVLAVRNALRVEKLDKEVRVYKKRERDRHLMIGESEALRAIRDQIDRAAPTPARILIRGESGTGKELVARALHEASQRRDGPFVKVNCAAIPEELIESELFGAKKGSYTGATESRDGKFKQADGGTLFLDEVGDMSLRAQAKVLRALQEGEIEKVGGDKALKVDVRVLAATNRDLEEDVRAGTFREDLFFRLNVVPIHVPPLRQRQDDVALLAAHFLSRYSDENDLPPREFTDDTLKQLAGMPWPGNVRELHNAVERLAIMATGLEITPDDLRIVGLNDTPPLRAGVNADAPQPLSPTMIQGLGGLVKARQAFEAACIRQCLTEAGGNVSGAARLLGIDRTNLHKKIQAYGLDDHKGGTSS